MRMMVPTARSLSLSKTKAGWLAAGWLVGLLESTNFLKEKTLISGICQLSLSPNHNLLSFCSSHNTHTHTLFLSGGRPDKMFSSILLCAKSLHHPHNYIFSILYVLCIYMIQWMPFTSSSCYLYTATAMV